MMKALLKIKLTESFMKDANALIDKYEMSLLDKVVISLIDVRKLSDELSDLFPMMVDLLSAKLITLLNDFEKDGVQYKNSGIFEELEIETIEKNTSTTQH